jgi:hypothetical protein
MPIVLVENEVTAGGRYDHWDDVTGSRYQFPNSYRNRVLPGERFVYYRGVRRTGGRRGVPEYFGCGVVGRVYIDPASRDEAVAARRKWICEIAEFTPFLEPVPFRVHGKTIENIPRNLWGVGVRKLSQPVYDRILRLAATI